MAPWPVFTHRHAACLLMRQPLPLPVLTRVSSSCNGPPLPHDLPRFHACTSTGSTARFADTRMDVTSLGPFLARAHTPRRYTRACIQHTTPCCPHLPVFYVTRAFAFLPTALPTRCLPHRATFPARYAHCGVASRTTHLRFPAPLRAHLFTYLAVYRIPLLLRAYHALPLHLPSWYVPALYTPDSTCTHAHRQDCLPGSTPHLRRIPYSRHAIRFVCSV